MFTFRSVCVPTLTCLFVLEIQGGKVRAFLQNTAIVEDTEQFCADLLITYSYNFQELHFDIHKHTS